MPANGYPMRLLLPRWEGNMNVKYLRRIKLVKEPAMSVYRRIPNVHADPAEWQSLRVLPPAGSQVLHHTTIAGPDVEEARALRHYRPRLFRHWADIESDGLRRWRPELGGGGAAGAGAQQGLHPVPHALALGWLSRSPAKSSMGRSRQCAASRTFAAQRGELKKVPPVTAVPNQHCNAITSWAVDNTGVVKHVYA